jgi:hypothetical protein
MASENNVENMTDHKERVTLLETLQRMATQSDGRGVPTLVNLWASRGGGKTHFLDVLAHGLNRSPEIFVVGPYDLHEVRQDRIQEDLTGVLTAIPQTSTKIVIMLDNLDAWLTEAAMQSFFDFERNVLLGLIERGNVIIIATSRAPINQWRLYETKHCQIAYAIPYLTQNETMSIADEAGIDPVVAFSRTLGHPRLLEWLKENPDLSEGEIASRAAAYFLVDVARPVAESAALLSLLPIFDVAILRQILPLNGTEIGEGFYTAYLDRIRELVIAGLVSWSADTGGYQFLDGAVRCLLARSFRFRRPEDAYRIHHVAANYFEAEASRAGYSHVFFVSVLYHLAYAACLSNSTQLCERCVTWARERLNSWQIVRLDNVRRAWQTGGGDWTVKMELDALLGPAGITELTTILEAGIGNAVAIS